MLELEHVDVVAEEGHSGRRPGARELGKDGHLPGRRDLEHAAASGRSDVDRSARINVKSAEQWTIDSEDGPTAGEGHVLCDCRHAPFSADPADRLVFGVIQRAIRTGGETVQVAE